MLVILIALVTSAIVLLFAARFVLYPVGISLDDAAAVTMEKTYRKLAFGRVRTNTSRGSLLDVLPVETSYHKKKF